mmetsp:Transcript_11047/g.24496  ORF Transcript_11047/g.24496 Transcript_11047/m.24496 type:complete len:342 (+) Transcript_11047:325-1350(+)
MHLTHSLTPLTSHHTHTTHTQPTLYAYTNHTQPTQRETDPYIKVHIGATSLHYGQACFEGMKAFHCKDGKVRIFRPDQNALRIARSCARVCMPEPPAELFIDAVKTAVRDNLDFMPPYGTGGAMYIRPLLFGSGPRIGLMPSDEYKLVVLVLPVSDYYKGGLSPVTAVVVEGYDRAAPKGVGNVKVAGNYAADLLPNTEVKKKGFPIALYLDSKTNQYIEEFSTSNFLGIDAQGRYVTPKSEAILQSITNKSLMQIAEDEGHEVQVRPVSMAEVQGGLFKEAGACGTAVVLTPVSKIVCGDVVTSIGEAAEVGPVLRKLYNRIRRIQVGDEEDKFDWMAEV